MQGVGESQAAPFYFGDTMDGRRFKLALAGSLLAGVIGCDTLTPKNPWASNTPTPPPPSPTSSASGKAVFVAEPEDETVKKDGPLQSTTLLAVAELNMQMSTYSNKSPGERDQLLNVARQKYNEILQRDPNNVDALLGLAKMYRLTGENERLLETESRLRERHSNNAKVWEWIAVRQGQSREWDNAADSYHHAVKLDPDNRLYRIHLGFTLARGARYDEAWQWLSRSMRETEGRFNLAQMMIHNGHPEKARQQLEYVMQADPNFKPAAMQLAAMNSGATPSLVPPLIDNAVRPVGHSESRPAPTRPTMSAPELMPEATPDNSRLAPPYTPTTGWDSTVPPR
jgi:Flp pilus assembly protein TadD